MQCKKIWSTNVKNGNVAVQTGDSNGRSIRGERKVNYIAIETSHFSRSRSHTTVSDCAIYLPHMPYLYTLDDNIGKKWQIDNIPRAVDVSGWHHTTRWHLVVALLTFSGFTVKTKLADDLLISCTSKLLHSSTVATNILSSRKTKAMSKTSSWKPLSSIGLCLSLSVLATRTKQASSRLP